MLRKILLTMASMLFSTAIFASNMPSELHNNNDSKQNALPPAYLSVKGFKNCLGTKNMGTWQSYCLPETKPQSCDNDAWSQLSSMTLPKC